MSEKSWGELYKHAQHDQKSHGSWARGRGGSSGRRKGKPEKWYVYEDDADEPGFLLNDKEDTTMSWERLGAEAPIGSQVEFDDKRGRRSYLEVTESGLRSKR